MKCSNSILQMPTLNGFLGEGAISGESTSMMDRSEVLRCISSDAEVF